LKVISVQNKKPSVDHTLMTVRLKNDLCQFCEYVFDETLSFFSKEIFKANVQISPASLKATING